MKPGTVTRTGIIQIIGKPDRRHGFKSKESMPREAVKLACNDTFDAGIAYACWHCLRTLHEKGISAAASASFPHSRDKCDLIPARLNLVHIKQLC